MTPILKHLRANLIAYLALFVALGGTGIAATELPAGSVGERQIQNHVIDPVKLNPNLIGGYVRAWATVSAGGRVVSSSGKVKIGPVFAGNQYSLTWAVGFPAWCPVSATVVGDSSSTQGFADVTNDGLGQVSVSTYVDPMSSGPEPFDVEVIC